MREMQRTCATGGAGRWEKRINIEKAKGKVNMKCV
jgi:hypothetical protein